MFEMLDYGNVLPGNESFLKMSYDDALDRLEEKYGADIGEQVRNGTLSDETIDALIEDWNALDECCTMSEYRISKSPIVLNNLEDAIEKLSFREPMEHNIPDDDDEDDGIYYCTLRWGAYYIAEIETSC